MNDSRQRLQQFLSSRGMPVESQALTADASTREYFRILWNERPAVACVYPDSFVAAEHPFLDVSSLFRNAGLPVAEVLDFDESHGVIVQEDLGDDVLRDVLDRSSPERRNELIDESIGLIARIQAETHTAFDTGSVASRLRFDTGKLLWELNFFKEHYFASYRKEPLPPAIDAALTTEFTELCVELDAKAKVLCHRDFHASNLMLDREGRVRIIDQQDARIGSVSYDLVSLLLDRITEPPTAEWLAEKRRFFLIDRESIGLAQIDEEEFAQEFRLQTIQRCLKAVGTFSYQSVNRGKTYFVPFIKPMFQIVVRAAENLRRFPTIQDQIGSEL